MGSDAVTKLGRQVPVVSIVNNAHYCKVAEREAAKLEGACVRQLHIIDSSLHPP